MYNLTKMVRSGDYYDIASILSESILSKDTLSFLLCDAAECDSLSLSKLLIQHGADVNYIWNGSYTPLTHAIENLSESVIIYLIHQGANTYHRTHDDNTILHWAIASLADYANDIFDYTNIRYTPCPHLLNIILSYPLDINAETMSGKTALDLTSDYHIPGAAELIIQHGGKPGSRKWHPGPSMEEKLESQTKLVKDTEMRLGPQHPDVATALMLLARLQDKPESLESLARALHIRETVLGSDHPDTEFTRYVLL